MRSISLVAFFVCLFSFGAFAQDKVFSQFYATPLTVNPALTGAFDGKYRFGAIYRDQWRGALDNPIVTFSASMDLRFDIGQKRAFRDAIAGGLVFFTDRVAGLDFNTNQFALSFAYHKALDRRSTQYLSGGLKMGFSQRNVNYGPIYFQDQFNGIDDFNLPTGENLPTNNFAFADLSTGIFYTVTPNRKQSFYAGIGIHHFNQPNLSFYEEEGISVPLFVKFNAHFGARLPLNENISLLPRLMASVQGPHIAIDAGSNLRIALNDYSSMALHLGTWVRPVRFNDSFGVDAVIVLVGLEYENVMFGLSYDSNVNSIANYGRMHGAFEISIAYLGEYENETIICPTF